jgi:predicted dehydrogenase
MSQQEKRKVGIIGFGKSGILHASCVNMNPDAKWRAVCDADEQVRGIIHAIYPDISVFSDVEEMLEKVRLDTIFICTPDHTHLPLAKQLIHKDVNIFVENPLAESLAPAQEMVRLASDNTKVYSVGFYSPFKAVLRKARNLFENGILETVKRYRASLQYSLPRSLPSRERITRIRASAFLYLIYWFFGPVKSMYAKAGDKFTASKSGASLILDHSSGLLGIADLSWDRPGYPQPAARITIEGTGGTLDISEDNLKLYLTKKKGEFARGWTSFQRADLPSPERFFLCEEGNYEGTSSFLESCSGKKQSPLSWEDGLEIIRMIEAADLAIDADREISLHEVK